jgi:hypothetical protein
MKKKLLVLIVTILSSVTCVNAQKVWDFSGDTTTWPTSTVGYSTNTVKDNLGIYPGVTITSPTIGGIIAQSLTFPDSFAGARYFRMGQASVSSGEQPSERYLYFASSGAGTIKIWFASGGSGSRSIRVTDGTNLIGVASSANSTTPAILTASYTQTSGFIYIYTSIGTGVNIFKIETTGTINDLLSPTWNGLAWLNGVPSATKDAIIDGTYSTTSNGTISSKKLTVNLGKSLTVNSGTNITVQNELINNGSFVVENNANLIQVNNTTNTGNVTIKRNSNALSRLDYTMWSSPVANQNLANFSPLTSQFPSRFYTYNSGANAYNSIDPTLTNFATGTGYLIRMPNTAVTAPATETFAGQFTGVPNNGNVDFTGLTAGLYYAIGNPYPSTLSADLFLSGNATDGTLYFWRKTNAAVGTAYATYTALGGAGTSAGIGGITPNGTIQVGQGFIVKPTGTTLNFTNTMRTANNSNQILKTKNVVEKDRVWLNLTNTTGVFSQTLVGYMDGATQGVDTGIDGAYINDSAVALTSAINGEEYTIQGRSLPFDPSDVVPLNFKTDVAGNYTIAIDHTDGLFANGQDVYLVDSATAAETNLKTDAYTFTATTGTANSRFSLKYQKTLKVDAQTFNENSVTVYKNNGVLYVNSGTSAINNIKVFDIQGRLIAEQNNVNTYSTSIKNWKANQQVLIVKITSQDNTVVNKKVVN